MQYLRSGVAHRMIFAGFMVSILAEVADSLKRDNSETNSYWILDNLAMMKQKSRK